MKFLHLGDLHFGKTLYKASLIEDQEYVLNQIYTLIKEEHIFHILIAGDLYDRAIPSVEAVKLCNTFLETLIDVYHCKVYIISGNHDSEERLQFVSGLLSKTGLYIVTDLKENCKIPYFDINENDVSVRLFMIPYMTPQKVRILSGSDSIHTYQEMMEYILSQNTKEIQSSNIPILMTHFLITNQGISIHSDSESQISVGGIDNIDASIFSDFSYVALGHLHAPQKVLRDTIRYSGSLLKYSESEIKQKKAFYYIDVLFKDTIQIYHKEYNFYRDFILLKGSFHSLIENPENQIKEYVSIVLTDPSYIENAMTLLKGKYPNCLNVTYDRIFTSDGISIQKLDSQFFQLPITEQFSEFYKEMTKEDLTEEQRKCIDSVLKGDDSE